MRWYHKVLILLTLVVLLVLFVFFGMKITTVHVEGTRMYSADEIKQSVFSRKYADNEFFFWIYQKMYGINTLPFVEEIDVSYDSLNTITLHVYDKKISGCIEYMGQYIYFDKDGIVLQSMKEKKEDVLVVNGIRFGTFTVGKAFNVKDDTLFQTIMNLSQLISHYKISVDKLQIEDKDILLLSGDIKVTLARKTMYDDEMSALSDVLKTAKKEKLKGTIDMPILYVVLPCYNEEAVLPETTRRLTEKLKKRRLQKNRRNSSKKRKKNRYSLDY